MQSFVSLTITLNVFIICHRNAVVHHNIYQRLLTSDRPKIGVGEGLLLKQGCVVMQRVLFSQHPLLRILIARRPKFGS